MSDENTLFQWLLGALGLGGGVMAWLFKRSIGQVDRAIEEHKGTLKEHDAALKQHDRQHSACTLDLANFKTEVARDYADKASTATVLT